MDAERRERSRERVEPEPQRRVGGPLQGSRGAAPDIQDPFAGEERRDQVEVLGEEVLEVIVAERPLGACEARPVLALKLRLRSGDVAARADEDVGAIQARPSGCRDEPLDLQKNRPRSAF
jgi:hypothetical protein